MLEICDLLILILLRFNLNEVVQELKTKRQNTTICIQLKGRQAKLDCQHVSGGRREEHLALNKRRSLACNLKIP